ncbi:uncharacterized protein FIBRA_04548 [Fibroporia radiculosa]|uniref:mRNA decay factor PAT1 domain-containing protein n=1 Tax=Fibroporia radiculosa TaxID=599839 RepID=J4H308_9APHY|nr:uncharacterized protein FIBRA_04548 [Fibroporia radiculosa]CCM02449.1 predicted protein [Fibroporia radiculosa]
MSFFGFEQPLNLESEKRKFRGSGGAGKESEDIAVYTWGEESYDGLGEELQERGDELNDETFGGAGVVGKDFDFSNTGHIAEKPPKPADASRDVRPLSQMSEQQALPVASQPSASSRPVHTLESVWDDKSPFSVLPRMNVNGASRTDLHMVAQSHTPQPARFSPFTLDNDVQSGPLSLGGSLHQGAHTLEEIEAEMRAATVARLQQQQQPQPQQQLPLSHSGQLRTQVRQGTPHATPTPPPRLHPHSQSPRFHHQQQHHQIQLIQLQQQQQQQQEQQRQFFELQELRARERQQLLQLEERLHLEELERERQRQMRQQQQQLQNVNIHNQLLHQRHASGGVISPALSDRQRRASPVVNNHHNQSQIPLDMPFRQSLPYLPQDIQLQQRLLAEMAQEEFLRNMQATAPQTEREVREERELQELLRAEAMRKIMEAERMEEKRRRKHAKIAHMSRYNDLMTQSDKDFITRIQVSQLVTQDPYADDFYAQVYGAILSSKMGVQPQDERVLKFGSGGGVGLGLAQKIPGRRQSAMQRMEAQVERIVNNARLREKEKISLNNLQGALGKTSGRSYKAAPRQLLQVDSSTSPTLSPAHAHISKADALSLRNGEGAAREAAKIGREALGTAAHTGDLVHKDPLTHREALVIIERLYDVVLDIEQLRRDPPRPEEEREYQAWEADCGFHVAQLWDGLRVMVPLETSIPHPFVSLLTPIKGKRLLPRVVPHLSTQQMLTVLTLLVACFSQLDVVIKAPVLDSLQQTQEDKEVEDQTQAFMLHTIHSILPVVAKAGLRLVSGLLGLLLERSDIVAIARTRPGLALLTLFLSRVEVIKQNIAAATESSEAPALEEHDQWQLMFDHLFQLLMPNILLLFPSIRLSAVVGMPFSNIPQADVMDQPVWQYLAAMALHASAEQQQLLVTSLREIVLENVTSVHKGWITDDEARKMRLANVNIFLHALGLDSSQIAM